MKTKIISIFILGVIILTSCNKDQKLIAEIAGEYQIDQITNYNKGKSVEVNLSSGIIYFDNCNMKDEIGSNCTGWYQIDNKQKVNFQYYTRKDKGKKFITISNPSSFEEPTIIGYYEFEKQGKNLIFKGVPGDTNGVSYSEYSDIKFSEK